MMPSHRSTGGKKKKFVRKNSARRAKNTYWQGTAGSICLIVFGVLCAMTFGTAENTIVSFEVTPGSSTSSSSSSVSSSVESGTAGGGISSSASSRPRGNHDRTPLIDNLPSECLPVIVKRRQLPNRTVTEEVLPPAEAEKVEHCYVDDGPPAVPACTCPAQITCDRLLLQRRLLLLSVRRKQQHSFGSKQSCITGLFCFSVAASHSLQFCAPPLQWAAGA